VHGDLKLSLTNVLKFVFSCLRRENKIGEKEKMIVFLGVDEFKKAHNCEEVRKEICEQMSYFYKHIEDDNTYLRVGFTSFLPEHVMEMTESGRAISFVHLTPLPLDVVSELFKKYIGVRGGNRAAIMICLGHQRALELLFVEFTKSLQSTKKTSGTLRGEGVASNVEREYFKDIMRSVAEPLQKYVPGKLSWVELEPAIVGRSVSMEGEIGKIYRRAVANGFYNNPISPTTTSIFPRCPL
jgi:tRNA threonylcarbamoyladenosine modification (KEOPS) complex Cgi121 subunit